MMNANIAFVPTATAWVPVGRDEVKLTHAEILEISRDWNGYATCKRGGYTSDYMPLGRQLRTKYAEWDMTMTDLRDVFNWFTTNMYDPRRAEFATV